MNKALKILITTQVAFLLFEVMFIVQDKLFKGWRHNMIALFNHFAGYRAITFNEAEDILLTALFTFIGVVALLIIYYDVLPELKKDV